MGAEEAVDVGDDGGGGLALFGEVGCGGGDLVQDVECGAAEAGELGLEVEFVEILPLLDRGRDGGGLEPGQEVTRPPHSPA